MYSYDTTIHIALLEIEFTNTTDHKFKQTLHHYFQNKTATNGFFFSHKGSRKWKNKPSLKQMKTDVKVP